ncbi:MAG: DNA alkylation repair protein [Candidatus Bathyarchaeia archaeon]
MPIEKLYSEVVRELEKRADAKIASRKKLMWHKEPGYRSYGIRTPELRAPIKSYLGRFERLSLEERLELARMFYRSGFSEQAGFGHTLLELSFGGITPSRFGFLDEVVGYFNNWATIDWFCIRVLQPLLRKYPQETLNLVREWNSSENMWKRRASVVVFVRKIGEGVEFVNEALELCDNLIWDEEDLVQKGVGWVLKDNMRGNKEKVLDYVKALRLKGAPSTIILYAIRGLKGEEREEVLKIKNRAESNRSK